MNRPLAALAPLCAALVLALAGCGSSGTSAGDYVKSICQAVGPFEKDVQARAGALNVAGITNPSSGKAALSSFLGAVVGDATTALDKLKSAGTPDVQNGGQISSALVGAFTKVQQALQSAQAQARALPTSSPDAFRTSATGIGTTIQGSLTGIGQGLSGLKSPALEKAASSEPACKSLSG